MLAELNKKEGWCSELQQHLRKMALKPDKAFGTRSVRPTKWKKFEKISPNPKVREHFAVLECSDVLKPAGPGKRLKGKKVAVLFSGGPASGGHNVIVGLHEMLKGNTLYGVRNGPDGLLNDDFFLIKSTKAIVNTGGFDFLGTGRKKIKTHEDLEQARQVCLKRKIDAIVIIGGDDSNTNAAILAEYLHADNIQVIGVPKTMDGDLQAGKFLPVPFGFDTATKVYANLVGNLCRDVTSSRKYWHFVRLMGRDASLVTLEVGLLTKPTYVFISEEIKQHKLQDLVDSLASLILARKNRGTDYGVVLVPEGLLDFIPEVHNLLNSLGILLISKRNVLKTKSLKRRRLYIARQLKGRNKTLYLSLPESVQEMMTLNRDSHGNIKVSQIPTEELLSAMVHDRLTNKDYKFQPVLHFFGYEGRCGPPTLFDANLGYQLGLTAGSMIHAGLTGYMAAYGSYDRGGSPYAVPLAGLMDVEQRNGENLWVIRKTSVSIKDPAFLYYKSRRKLWQKEDRFSNPGPIQYCGKPEMPLTIALNQKY